MNVSGSVKDPLIYYRIKNDSPTATFRFLLDILHTVRYNTTIFDEAVSRWDSGAKVPSVEMLCKLADLYCVSTDFLLGRDELTDSIPRTDDIIPVQTLRTLNGKPVWDESRGWCIVNGIQDYVIFMDGSKVILAEALNLRAMTPAYSMGYSPAAKPVSHEDLVKYESIWVQPISPDSFWREEARGWYHVHEFYVENEYGTRFLFDTYGTKWLAFEMEFQ